MSRKVEDGSYLGIPAPIVINITDGEPCDGTSTAKDRAVASAKELLSLCGTDGNVTLFNLHISDEGVEIVFPGDKNILNGCPEGDLLLICLPICLRKWQKQQKKEVLKAFVQVQNVWLLMPREQQSQPLSVSGLVQV